MIAFLSLRSDGKSGTPVASPPLRGYELELSTPLGLPCHHGSNSREETFQEVIDRLVAPCRSFAFTVPWRAWARKPPRLEASQMD